MSEMVERVAAAIWGKEYGEAPAMPWERVAPGSSLHVRIISEARAAIAAMREPTWPMITAARRVQLTHPDDYVNEKGYFAQAYRYMIDAVLEDA
jgi:hypothetical protein